MATRKVYPNRRLLRMRNALVAVIAIALALILSAAGAESACDIGAYESSF